MRTLSILLCILFFGFGSFGQQSGKVVATIKGKVIDAKTNEPVGFTNISLEGTYYGTASTGDGDFELKITEELSEKNILFSAVGFVNRNFPVAQLFEKEYSIIKLEPQNYDIGKVDIYARSKVLMRILQMASENTPRNMVAGPLNYTAKYMNTITSASTINQTADVIFYDQTGYLQPSKLNAFNKLYYALHKSDWEADYRFATGKTEIDNLLSFDWVRTGSSVLNPDILLQFQLALDSEPTILGKECWIISFEQDIPTLEGSGDFYAEKFSGKITIRKEDYSVVSIEGEIQSQRNSSQGRSLAIGKETDMTLKNVQYSFKTDYRNLMLSSISVEKSYTQNGKNITENSLLNISDVKTSNLTLIESRDYFTGE